MDTINKLKIFEQLKRGEHVRILAFGSSNTQRSIGVHWFDHVELAVRNTYGNIAHFINSGVSGNTTVELLARFDRDVAFFQPHLVIVTIGGNDANPKCHVSGDDFRKNLTQIVQKIEAIGAQAMLQTYYGCDLERLGSEHAAGIVRNMQIIREVAIANNLSLVDHFSAWDVFRQKKTELYRSLMKDPQHLNILGNMVFGLEIIDFLNLTIGSESQKFCREGIEIKKVIANIMQESE